MVPWKEQNQGSWTEVVLRNMSRLQLPKHTPELIQHLNLLCWNFFYSCQNLFNSQILDNTLESLMCNNQEYVIFFKYENFVKIKMHFYIHICCELCVSTLSWSCIHREYMMNVCSMLRRHVWILSLPTWQWSFFFFDFPH